MCDHAKTRRLAVLMLATLVGAPFGALPPASATMDADVSFLQQTWEWDLDRSKVDDQLEAMIADGSAPATVALFVHYLAPPTAAQAAHLESLGGTWVYRFHALPTARVLIGPERVADLVAIPEVWGIELVPEMGPDLEFGVPTLKVRPSTTYPDSVWDTLGYRGEGMVIAILDTGVDETHQDLDDLDDDPETVDLKFVAGADTTSGTPVDVNPQPDHLHGTHVAGIALGTGSIDYPACTLGGPACRRPGVAPQAHLVDVKIAVVTDLTGGVAMGFDWVIKYNAGLTLWGDPGEHRIDVASLSFGCPCHGAGGDFTSRIVNEVVRSGVVVTIAAGNSGPGRDTLGFPAVADGAITVANSDDRNTVNRADDLIAGSSSRGPRPSDNDGNRLDELKPEVTAPGTGIFAPLEYSGHGYVGLTGTSMAAPHVAGVAALMLQANPALRPIDPEHHPVRDILVQTAETRCCGADTQAGYFGRTWNNAWGYGLVDGYEAVRMALATPAPALQVFAGGPYRGYAGVPFEARASVGGGTAPYALAWDLDGDGAYDDATGDRVTLVRSKGSHALRVRATDAAGAVAEADATAQVAFAAFYDSFDGAEQGWTAREAPTAPGGELTRWQRLDASLGFSWDRPTSGSRFYYVGAPTGQVEGMAYTGGANAILESPLIDLTRARGRAELRYDASGSVLGGTAFIVEVRRASEETWSTLTAMAGNRLGMLGYAHDLTPYLGDTIQVRYRFTTTSALVCCIAGWYLDSVAVTVSNMLPRAAIGVATEDPTDLEPVAFASRSTDADGRIVGHLWDFGDGRSSTEASPRHLYDDGGTYTVRLTVTDDDGATDTTTMPLEVRDVPPLADFAYVPLDPFTVDTVGFEDRSIGKALTYAWSFGDGVASAARAPAHRFPDDGVFGVRLVVTDDEGRTSEHAVDVVVRNVPPAARFAADDRVMVLEPVSFDDLSADVDGAVVQWNWDFDDGTHAHEPEPTHVFLQGGVYRVQLTVTDDDGDTGTASMVVAVCAPGVDTDALLDPSHIRLEVRACIEVQPLG